MFTYLRLFTLFYNNIYSFRGCEIRFVECMACRAALIIGDARALAAKLRLRRKAPPLVDVIASSETQWRSEFVTDTAVCWLGEIDPKAAKAALKDRPLVMLTCEDESLNRFLVATAWAYGVPVNVVDNREI